MKKSVYFVIMLSTVILLNTINLGRVNVAVKGINSDSQIIEPLVDESGVENLYGEEPRASIQGVFPEPTVEVLSFTDHEMQLTGDGNDTIRFSMEFEPSQNAFYSAVAYLYTNSSVNREQIGDTVHWDKSVTGGTITVAVFDFCAYYLRDKNIDGSYAIYLDFYKNNGSIYTIYNHEFVHETKVYNSSDFQEKPVTIETVSLNFVDNDANDRYEWIDFTLSVNVTMSGSYRFSGEIRDTNYGLYEDAARSMYLEVGTNSVVLRFNGWKYIDLAGNSTIKLYHLTISHEVYPYYTFVNSEDIFYESSIVDSTDFDVPPLVLTGRFTDKTIDEDADGVYEEYWITIEINKTRVEDGHIVLRGSLYENASMSYIEDEQIDINTLDTTGILNVTFKFAGFHIHESGIVNDTLILDNIYGYYYYYNVNYPDVMNCNYSWVSSAAYLYSDFIGAGASFTGNITSFGRDSDSDGLYNDLVVEIEVNVTRSSYYNFYGTLEITTSGFNIGWSTNYSYLIIGKHCVQLVFDGSEIFRSGLNGTIDLTNLYLYDSELGTTYGNLETINLGHYVNIEFDPPKAWFTGIYSEMLVDENSNGFWDDIEIFAEVEVNESSRYRLTGYLRNPETGEMKWAGGVSQYFSTGTHSMVLLFDGQWVWKQHTNVSYVLSNVRIEEVDESNNFIKVWDEVSDIYTTNLIDSNSFESPRAYFTGRINETRVDTDSDGDYDLLVMFVEIYCTEQVNIKLEGSLSTGLDAMNAQNVSLVSSGFTWLKLTFVSGLLYSQGSNSSYEVYFDIIDMEGGVHLDSIDGYKTAVYSWMEWNSPGLLFSGKIYDTAVDSDNNLKADFIELQLEVGISQAASYHVYGYIAADDGGSFYSFSWGYDYVGVASYHNITIEIDLSWIRSHSNGTLFYLDSLVVYQYFDGLDCAYRIGSYQKDVYFTNVYYHEDFDLPDAFVLGIINDYGVDYDSDGLYNDWAVVFQVNITVNDLDLYLEARLGRMSTGDYITSTYAQFTDLTVGIHNLTLLFSGVELESSKFSGGAKIIYYRLVRNSDWQTLEESWEEFVLSNTYRWSDFNSQPFTYVAITSVAPISGSVFYYNDLVEISVLIEHSVGETINTVIVTIEVDGAFDHHEYLSIASFSDTEEVWTGIIELDHGTVWDLEVEALTDSSSDIVNLTYYVFGAPVFYDFSVNISSVSKGGSVNFKVDIWDVNEITSVTLFVAGYSYNMVYIGNSTYGMIYSANVTFIDTGEFLAYVNATNLFGFTTRSFVRTIYVCEGSEILSVIVTPSLSIETGQSVTFAVVIRKSDVIITSVSLYDEAEDTNYALERITETNTNETWAITYTPTEAGRHVCTITVLNTRNQVSSYEEIFEVVGDITMNITPGFGFLIPIMIFSLLYQIKIGKRRQR